MRGVLTIYHTHIDETSAETQQLLIMVSNIIQRLIFSDVFSEDENESPLNGWIEAHRDDLHSISTALQVPALAMFRL